MSQNHEDFTGFIQGNLGRQSRTQSSKVRQFEQQAGRYYANDLRLTLALGESGRRRARRQ